MPPPPAKLTKLNNSDKKYKVEINRKTIKFGAAEYQDYTQHKDKNRRLLYINRHKKNENWQNKYSAGFWSRWLLWEKKTIKEAKLYITKRFGIKFE